ncbi:MAG: propionyl-CoA synthetase [Bacteroidetes bacterium]|nr:MAG: propionyl-CoA synthetase [Bacteroidota bacterium]
MDYQQDYPQSINDPEAFWLAEARKLAWFEFPGQGLSRQENGLYRWFEGGKLNTAWLALDHQVENGRAEQTALIYDSPVTGTQKTYTYRELRNECARFAGALQELGLTKGDTAIIYMPMIPQAVIAMLACARIGVVHSVVFGGFSAHELAIRIDDARPRVLLTATCGIEFSRIIEYQPIIEEALRETHYPPAACVVYERDMVKSRLQPDRDHDWDTLTARALPVDCVPVDATDPLYILYTSGTTGKPKGIVRDHGGHAVALQYSMKHVYGADPGDVFWAASDVGWVVGHSYIAYGPLIHGCTTLLYEGKPIRTPDPGAFWRVIAEHRVNVFFVAPTALRAIKKEDPEGLFKRLHPTPSLRHLFVAGERCDVATWEWATRLLGIPVIDHWWQTESGWPMLANMAGYGLFPIKPGSAGKPVCGFDVRLLEPDGSESAVMEEGAVVIRLPLPPGSLPTLWKNDEGFIEAYLSRFPGYYLAGDGGYRDADGYLFITGRIDDVINVAGHRLSTAEMEEVLAAHPSVAECAVIGIEEALRGQVPLGLVVLKEGIHIAEADLEAELVALVRHGIGALACFREALIVKRLPKTRSGKILRKTLRMMADGKAFTLPSTIEDPSVLDEIAERMRERKVGKGFGS